jgi:acyl-CoA thioesterase-1
MVKKAALTGEKTMELVRNVHVFGDSIMKGIVLDKKARRYMPLPDINFRKIEEKFAVRIFNRSRFGCTVTKGLAMLRKFLEKEQECDCVLLEYGGNDCNFKWEEVAAHPDKEHKPATELPVFKDMLREMVNLLKRYGIRPVMMTLPPVDAEKYLAFMADKGLNTENILEWLGDAQMIYRYQELYSAQVAALAEETGSPLVDVRRLFLDKTHPHPYKRLICDDGIHPSAEGHELIYQAFDQFMKQKDVNGVSTQPLNESKTAV